MQMELYENECYLPIKDFENYFITNKGRVWSIKRKIWLSKNIDKDGYEKVSLKQNKNHKIYFIHRLIALYFIPNIHNKPLIDHIDNNRQNNNLDNLRWCDYQENMRNRIKASNSTSKYKGVCYRKRDNIWISSIFIKKSIWIGSFKTELEAINSYNKYIIDNNLQEFYNLNII